jgi:NAD(P)-dependent dehydrogenase (short-subunit alcohol dehydrogenase family)
MDIAGKHIVITGAASGIGRAMAQRFHAEGAAKLFLVDLNEAPLKEVAEPLGADYCVCNVGLEHDVLGTIKRAEAALGHIDLLCNNAGISVRGGPEVDTADWQRIWEINVMAHVWASRAALPAMLERGDGYILNTASAAGLLSQIGSAPYAVTKHAAVSFAEWLSITYGDRGIKVSVLCPQAVRTAMIAGNEDGVASVDGLMEPEALCDTVVATLAKESFLVLPHEEVRTYIQRKAGDYDRWLKGMRRLQTAYGPEGGL